MIHNTFPHYFHSEIHPSNKEEMLDAIENADLMDEQDCSWVDGCLVKFERLNFQNNFADIFKYSFCLLYTSPSPRDATLSRMPSSA